MQQIIIEAELRTQSTKGATRTLRREGRIPGVFYGKGQDNINLSVNEKELNKAIASEMGMNTLLQLKIKGGSQFNALLRDYQADPIKRNFTHVDFVHVDLSKKILISIPVHLTGKPVGVKEGGILDHMTREIKVLCLPTHIPKEIVADVTDLKIGQNLHLSNLKLPEGAELHEKADLTIAAVIAPKEEVEAAPAAMVEPEVLTAKKEGEAAPATPTQATAEAKAEKKK